jgi:hypothetical protein
VTSTSRAPALLPLTATWLVAFAALLSFLWPLALLFDSDSYYHLAIARAYWERGLFSDLPWARFSAMHQGFGDKELLFHLLLLPAAAARDPELGAKITLAALDATILTSFAQLSLRAAGPLGLVLPALALFGSQSFDLRLIRLRPELLALLLLLWTVHALSERRAWLAAVCAAAFALGYTAIHALLGVCCLCFGLRYALDAKPSWKLIAYPCLGALVGLLLHPHFPHNLRIFYLQNFEFWRYQHTTDIGDEILPIGFVRWLAYDWPLLVGCTLLAATLRRAQPLDRACRDMGLVCCVAALPFVMLFVHSARFALYAVPLGLLAAAWLARLYGWRFDARLLQRGPRVWLALSLLGVLSLPLTASALEGYVDRAGCIWPALRGQLEALGRALPTAAKVAAPWDSSEDYMYFAPQGRYLNVLDPLFMRAAHPAAYAAQRALFLGETSDVPLSLIVDLDSDYLAFPARRHLALHAQLAGDPRFERRVPHGQVLYRVRPEGARMFVRDYRVAATRAGLSQPSAAFYPRHPNPAGREVEAIVDGARLPKNTCTWLAPQDTTSADFEIASTASTRIWIDDQIVRTLEPSQRSIPGQGTIVRDLARPQLALEVCPTSTAPFALYMLAVPPSTTGEPLSDR